MVRGDDRIIVVDRLSKRFGEVLAVRNISFSVSKGQIFAFLGPNGAGKTTTIKMLTTLIAPSSGRVLVNGFDPVVDNRSVRSSFGIVFQDQSLDDELTAMENLVFHAGLYGISKEVYVPRIKHLLSLVELWDRRDSLVKTFSGGMKRRLEIARGLIHHPKILFLDEPTLGLDPQTRNHLWDYVLRLNKDEGMTVFFTTHYMNEAEKYASMVAIIDHGKIIVQGTSSQLKKKTRTSSLEDAFLKVTGHKIREEEASAAANFRNHARAWGKK